MNVLTDLSLGFFVLYFIMFEFFLRFFKHITYESYHFILELYSEEIIAYSFSLF